ncbi:MAG: single-stranded DNA-binding protein [bacterium]|nr:single-stranded DNA-binding protein [bacterium]
MAASLNKVLLIGRLGKDPEITFTGEGIPIVKFSLATDESFIDRDGKKVERTEWHNIIMYRKKAELANQYLKKGMLVYIEGKIQSRDYVDRDNVNRRAYEIIASDFTMLSSRGKEENVPNEQENEYQEVYTPKAKGVPTGPKPPNSPRVTEKSKDSGWEKEKPNTPRVDEPPDIDIESDLPF